MLSGLQKWFSIVLSLSSLVFFSLASVSFVSCNDSSSSPPKPAAKTCAQQTYSECDATSCSVYNGQCYDIATANQYRQSAQYSTQTTIACGNYSSASSCSSYYSSGCRWSGSYCVSNSSMTNTAQCSQLSSTDCSAYSSLGCSFSGSVCTYSGIGSTQCTDSSVQNAPACAALFSSGCRWVNNFSCVSQPTMDQATQCGQIQSTQCAQFASIGCVLQGTVCQFGSTSTLQNAGNNNMGGMILGALAGAVAGMATNQQNPAGGAVNGGLAGFLASFKTLSGGTMGTATTGAVTCSMLNSSACLQSSQYCSLSGSVCLNK